MPEEPKLKKGEYVIPGCVIKKIYTPNEIRRMMGLDAK